ncbi:MAG: hypothetical protein U0736_02250 [Gemmataceae bacterium]
MARTTSIGPALADDVLQAGAVDMLHDQVMQVAFLVDVVGADDVRVVEAATARASRWNRSSDDESVALVAGSTLTATPPHQRVFAQVHAAHAAGASRSSTLYLPMVKRRHFPCRNCSPWKWASTAVADQHAGQPVRLGRQLSGRPQTLDVSRQSFVIDDATLSHQLEQFIYRCRCRHRLTCEEAWARAAAERYPIAYQL